MMVALVNHQFNVRGDLRFGESMAKHTSWRAGGNAEIFFAPADRDDLADFILQLDTSTDILWLGLGSNLLVRDGGFAGAVIDTRKALQGLAVNEFGFLYAGAGISVAKLARFAVANGFQDAEFFAGIPGTVGGALAMNAGAWGGETWRYVRSVETFNRQGQVNIWTPEDYQIAYRSATGPEGWFLSAEFAFRQAIPGFDSLAKIKSMLAKRSASQPMQTANAGSVFRNPEGDYAARLIGGCGLKGEIHGGAQIAEKHANFIINNGNASAADIEFLIDLARQQVSEQTGITLETEVRIVGDRLGVQK